MHQFDLYSNEHVNHPYHFYFSSSRHCTCFFIEKFQCIFIFPPFIYFHIFFPFIINILHSTFYSPYICFFFNYFFFFFIYSITINIIRVYIHFSLVIATLFARKISNECYFSVCTYTQKKHA